MTVMKRSSVTPVAPRNHTEPRPMSPVSIEHAQREERAEIGERRRGAREAEHLVDLEGSDGRFRPSVWSSAMAFAMGLT